MLEKKDNETMLELFFKKPHYTFHLRELCRILNWSPTKVRSYIEILKKKKLIKETREKHMALFHSDRDSEEFRKHKIIYNISKAFKIAETIEDNIEDFDAIIFFGSARKGEDTEKSDFDLCIFGAKEKEINLKKIEKDINRNISILFIESPQKLKKENKELLNNLLNGIVVKGYFRVFE